MRRRAFGRRIDLDRADPSDLLRLARDGDTSAEAAFIARTIDDVHRYCAHLVGRSRADDATQATYLKALGSMRSYRGDAPAMAWLIGVARHTCYDVHRRTARRARLSDRLHLNTLESDAVVAAVDDRVSNDAALDSLADSHPDRFEAFVLTQVLGLSYADAAEVLGCPVGTVRSRVARARADLAAWMVSDDDSDLEATSPLR